MVREGIQDIFVTLCYAIMLPGRKSSFRVGIRPDSNRESLKIGPAAGLGPAGRRANFQAFLIRIRPKSGVGHRFPARKHYRVPWDSVTGAVSAPRIGGALNDTEKEP